MTQFGESVSTTHSRKMKFAEDLGDDILLRHVYIQYYYSN